MSLCRGGSSVARRVSRSLGGLVTRSFGCATSVSFSLPLSRFYSRIQLMIVVSGLCGFFVLPSLEEFPTPTLAGLSAAALGANFGNNLAFIASSWLHVAFAFALCDVQLAPRGTTPVAGAASVARLALSPGNSRLSQHRADPSRDRQTERKTEQTGTLPQRRFRFAVSQMYCQLPAAPTILCYTQH